MSARPSSRFDTAQYERKWAKIEKVLPDGPSTGPWSVCACHGHLLLWDSWAGLVKGGKKRRRR